LLEQTSLYVVLIIILKEKEVLKRFIIITFVLSAVNIVNGQNEIGAYFFPQATSIKNIQSPDNEAVYDTKTTFSGGLGVNYIHFFNDKYDYRNMLHKFGLRTDLIYSAHNQKFASEWTAYEGDKVRTHEGKKRLDYIKLAVNIEYARPFTRHMSYIFYGGPQLSYLVKSDGGIVAWRDREDEHVLYLLPPAGNDYYKSFTLDFVLGGGFDYELTRFLNFSTSARLDFGITTMDKVDAVVNDYEQFNTSLSRKGSRNASLAILLGVEYTLHQPEHAKTRY